MKEIIIITTIIIKLVFSYSSLSDELMTADMTEETEYLEELIVCIDPGHQEEGDYTEEPIGPGLEVTKPRVTDGTKGIVTGVNEYELVLDISLKLKAKLEDKGYKVIMTRDKHQVNISNVERAQIANETADIFVRIHADENYDQTLSGISVLCPADNDLTGDIYTKSHDLSKYILSSLIESTQANDLGIIYRSDISGFNWSKKPVTLVEVGFMSNPKEDERLNTHSYQIKIVKGIVEGIENYFSNQ